MVPRSNRAERRPSARAGEDCLRTPIRGSKGGAAETETLPPPPAPPNTPPSPSYTPGPPPEPRPRRPRGAVAGLVLVAIGLLALAGQVVPGLAWWRMWPLIIVAAGLVQAFTPGRDGWNVDRMFDGFVTCAFGFVILAITTGAVSISVFWQLLTLWPVLLIAIGLDLLGKALHSSWVRALGSIAVIAALAYAVALNAGAVGAITLTPGASSGVQTRISEPVGSVRQANLQLDAGVANVTLTSGNELVTAEGVSPWSTPDFSVDRAGGRANVYLSLGEGDGVVVWPGRPNARLDAALADSVLWDMKVNTGVSALNADLQSVPVRSLELKPGVADCKVKLGEVPAGVSQASVVVKAGVSSVALHVPRAAEARIESDSGLTGHDISGDFNRIDNHTWETAGYASARKAGSGVWVITVKSGVGSIAVDTY